MLALRRRILEAGHYYAASGPTIWSDLGWKILHSISDPEDHSLLFVDDVHPYAPAAEQNLPPIEFLPCPPPVHRVLESSLVPSAWKLLGELTSLPKRKRARQSNRNGQWYFKDFPITEESGQPNCVLLDAALCLLKESLGYKTAVNILPTHYAVQQKNLLRVLPHLDCSLELKVVLYNLEGSLHELS